MIRWICSIAAMAMLLVPAPLAAGQSRPTTADVTGVVIDAAAMPIAGATVIVTSADTGVARMTASGESGRFVLLALPVGGYRIDVQLAGFWPVALEQITLTLGEPLTLEVTLTPSTFEERVAVAGRLIRPEGAGSVTVLRDRIESLPTNGRHFIDFAVLGPAVTPDQTPQQGATRTSGLAFAGQHARSNNVMVDGLDNNDEVVGSVRALFSQEAVREFQVIAGAPTAEFGKASGGIVNVVTRSGGNRYEGTAYGFLRDRALDAKGHFERVAPSGESIQRDKAPFHQTQAGAALGGPLRRDATFFFVSYERLAAEASNFVTIDDESAVRHPLNPALVLGTPAAILRNAGFPVDTGNVPYDLRRAQFFTRVDWHTPAQTVALRFNAATEANQNIEPFGGLVARSAGAELSSTDVIGAMTHSLVWGERTVFELRAQAALRNQTVRSLDPRCGATCEGESSGGPALDVAGVASVGRQRFTPTLRDTTRYQIVETVTRAAGAHELRAGIDASYNQGRRQTLPLYFGGRYIFQDVSLPLVAGQPPVPLTAIQEVALGLPLAYVQGYGTSGAADSFTDASLFVQDSWRMASGVTLNAGLRYQRQFWPEARFEPAGYPGSYAFPSDGNNLAPRLAVSWQPDAGRRTTIEGGYGIYYDHLITSLFGVTKYINGTESGLRTLVLRAPAAFAAWAAPDHRLSEAAARQLADGTYPSLAITIAPRLETPYAHHLVGGVERQFARGLTAAVHAHYVRGFAQVGTIDYNPLVPSLGPGRRPADVNGVPGTSASVLQYTSYGETWYRALTLTVGTRPGTSAQLQATYTLSKAEDNTTDFQSAFLPENNGAGRDPNDPDGLPIGFRPEQERGSSVQDQRHRLVVSGTAEAGYGIRVSGIFTAGSGHPFNILAGADLNGDGDGGSPSADRARSNPADPASSVGRNAGTLPASATLDVRVTRRFRVGRTAVEPIVEAFNVLNRTNFIEVQNVFGAGTYPSAPRPTYGQFTRAAPPRQVQLAVRLSF